LKECRQKGGENGVNEKRELMVKATLAWMLFTLFIGFVYAVYVYSTYYYMGGTTEPVVSAGLYYNGVEVSKDEVSPTTVPIVNGTVVTVKNTGNVAIVWSLNVTETLNSDAFDIFVSSDNGSLQAGESQNVTLTFKVYEGGIEVGWRFGFSYQAESSSL
jgi:hypothetical protein